jgi:serine/threonine protein phosphatase 1
MKSNAPIRKLPANTVGKDYVIGDLHGCYGLLEQLLNEVDFDKARDRLFSVGDLIDRGPDSLRCLQLLEEPWFYAVRGNHELMMLDFFSSYLASGKFDPLEDIIDNGFLEYGGDWVSGYVDSDRHCMAQEFNRGLILALQMPLMWVVGEGSNRFHVIHAELVRPDYKTAGHIVWLDSDIDQWLERQFIPPEVEQRLYWSRTLMSSQLADQEFARTQTGLSLTFCGHTYAAKPRQLLSHLCLDTGAFMSWWSRIYGEEGDNSGLTLFDVQESRWVSASYMRESIFWSEVSAG